VLRVYSAIWRPKKPVFRAAQDAEQLTYPQNDRYQHGKAIPSASLRMTSFDGRLIEVLSIKCRVLRMSTRSMLSERDFARVIMMMPKTTAGASAAATTIQTRTNTWREFAFGPWLKATNANLRRLSTLNGHEMGLMLLFTNEGNCANPKELRLTK